MINANYGGRQANIPAYIKNFNNGNPVILWKLMDYETLSGTTELVITPTSDNFKNLYIPGDLFVDGNIINPSDVFLKKNIKLINDEASEKIMNLKPSSFEFKDDLKNSIHYGFIAGDFENEYPELVQTKPDQKYSKIKSINYLEIIPLLVHKIQKMQIEIDDLKGKIDIKK
jgi:hypothetical protein